MVREVKSFRSDDDDDDAVMFVCHIIKMKPVRLLFQFCLTNHSVGSGTIDGSSTQTRLTSLFNKNCSYLSEQKSTDFL